MRHGFVGREAGFKITAIECYVSALVTHCVTVVWCREDCYALSVMCNLVAFMLHFVATYDIVEIVQPQKPVRHIWTELHANTTFAR